MSENTWELQNLKAIKLSMNTEKGKENKWVRYAYQDLDYLDLSYFSAEKSKAKYFNINI